MDDVNDDILLKAMRKRILDEINRREQASGSVINNVYGGGGSHMPLRGVSDQLGSSPEGEDPYDYFVDITRRDLDEVNPATGKPAGWKKSVHRHRQPKDAKKKVKS